MKVFAYGTLKSEHGNNRILSSSRFVKEATIFRAKLYYSYGNGSFPVAKFTEGNDTIVGEIWDISGPNMESTLQRLDMLEGVPTMYTRETAVTDCGEQVHLYIGSPRTFDFSRMTEVTLNLNNQYEWSR